MADMLHGHSIQSKGWHRSCTFVVTTAAVAIAVTCSSPNPSGGCTLTSHTLWGQAALLMSLLHATGQLCSILVEAPAQAHSSGTIINRILCVSDAR